MDETLVIGAMTLAGVVIGAVLNERTHLRLEKRRETREEKRERRTIRRARRLVADELQALSQHLSLVVLRDSLPSEWLIQTDRYLPTGEWQRSKDVLAEMLEDDEVWESLPILYHNVQAFRYRLEHNRDAFPFAEEEVASIMMMSQQAQDAAAHLRASG